MSDTLRALITDRTDVTRLRKAAMRQGMNPLRLAALQKAAMGVTSLDEALKSSPPPPIQTG